MKLKELEKRLRQEPDNLGLRVTVAGLMREAGRSIEAVELYRSVALAYRDQGRVQQAIAVCRSILEIAPDDAACQGLLDMLRTGAAARPTAPATAQPGTPTAPMAAQPPPSPSPRASSEAQTEMRNPTQPPPTVRVVDPTQRSNRRTQEPVVGEPVRRASLDETPLPRPVPYHVIDPTSQPNRISSGDLELDTKPGDIERPSPITSGLAEAARRISGLITDTRGVPRSDLDLSSELDTRQLPRIETGQLKKLENLPITAPLERLSPPHLDEPTQPPRDSETDLQTAQHRRLTPPPDELDAEADALTPPPLSGRPPTFVPGIRREGAPAPVRPMPKAVIPPLPRASRDSQDEELTQPRIFDDDDD